MNTQQIKINGFNAELNTADFGYRLQRYIQNSANFSQKGGDFSTTLSFPLSKTNKRIFSVSTHTSGINKFRVNKWFICEIYIDGVRIFMGVFKLRKITSKNYEGDLSSDKISWAESMDNLQLNKLGYVNGQPTWTAPFEGGSTINLVNEQNNTQTDFICPTILYNNTPVTDYLSFTDAEIFGSYDGIDQTAPGLNFPDDFKLFPAYFGPSQGLTFEDFPPALYYANLLKRCFAEIGWTIQGDIFQQEWFNKLYLPYVGGGYKWNWKTLAELYAEPEQRTTTTMDGNTIASPNQIDEFNFLEIKPTTYWGMAVNPRIPKTDTLANRIDRIANFNKFIASDSTNEYICPADGRYKIRVKSYIKKTFASPILMNLASFTGYEWDNAGCYIYRKNQAGDFVLNQYTIEEAGKWILGSNDEKFTNEANDCIAYLSPKQYNLLGNTQYTNGSPLTNFEEQVNVINSVHNILTFTPTNAESESACEFEIELDMLKNERIGWKWVVTGELYTSISAFDAIAEQISFEINDANSEIEVQFMCGIEDLDLAGNLPETNVKQFIGNFFNFFNLHFETQENTKTLTVYTEPTYYNSVAQAYDITGRVIEDSIELTPCDLPKRLNIGYENDDKDRLLTTVVDMCENSISETNQYANILLIEQENLYANGDLNIKNGFSSTKFYFSNAILTDINDPSFNVFLITATNPGTGATFRKGLGFTGDVISQTNEIPSIQSLEQFNSPTVQNLEYIYDYAPRILYHLGTTASYLGYGDGYRFKIDAPQIELATEERWWIKPTISSFDIENNNPYPTLRFDTINGIYNSYFENIVNIFNTSYILTCKAVLRATDWIKMKGNVLVKIQNDVFRLLEITDYDPITEQECTIKLIKIV